jgi:hypothetical protein
MVSRVFQKDTKAHLTGPQVRRPLPHSTRDSAITPPLIRVGTSCHRHPAPHQHYNLRHILYRNNSNMNVHAIDLILCKHKTKSPLSIVSQLNTSACLLVIAPITIRMKKEQVSDINNDT